MKQHAYELLLGLFALIAIGCVVLFRHDSARIQAIAALFSFLATLLLLKVTRDYAKITRDMADASRKVYLHYWLDLGSGPVPRHPSSLIVRVANLSANTVLIKESLFRFSQEFLQEPKVLIPSGSVGIIGFPCGHLAGKSGEIPVAIRLRYLAAGTHGETPFTPFEIEIRNDQVIDFGEEERPEG